MSVFASARFTVSVAEPEGLPPPSAPEIAFAGRSNAGKSTVINVLTNQKRLAFASNTPGRTQLINYFALSARDESGAARLAAYLVDLPGYGYAKAPAAQREQWDALVGGYVAHRQTLIGIVMVIDARRGLMSGDETLIDFVGDRHCRLHLLLNKADQLNNAEQKQALALARARAQALGNNASAQLFSGLRRTGLDELTEVLGRWLQS